MMAKAQPSVDDLTDIHSCHLGQSLPQEQDTSGRRGIITSRPDFCGDCGMEYKGETDLASKDIISRSGAGDSCNTELTEVNKLQISGFGSSRTDVSDSPRIVPKASVSESSREKIDVMSSLQSDSSTNPANSNLPAKLDDAISEEVELTIKRVIEESMQQILGSEHAGDRVDAQTIEVITNSMEESLQGVINHLGGDSTILNQEEVEKTNVKLKFPMNHPDNVSKSGVDDLSNETSKNPSLSRVGISSLKETDTLQSWKEAGRALRIALNKYSSSNKDESSGSIALSSTSEPPSDHCASRKKRLSQPRATSTVSQAPWDTVAQKQNQIILNSSDDNCDDAPSRHHVACLTRSMQQSISLSAVADPMNEMWENYQSNQSPDYRGIIQDVHRQTLPGQGSEDWASLSSSVNSPPESVDTRDLSLTELREKMRVLMSNLPISKNKQENVSRENDSLLISSDSGIVRSPKISKKRHHKISKGSSVNESDDEEEENISAQRSPPKIKATGHKFTDSSQTKHCVCKINKNGSPKSNIVKDIMPDLVLDSQSDLNSSQDSSKENTIDKHSLLDKKHINSTDHTANMQCSQQHLNKNRDKGGKNCKHKQPVMKHTESVQNFADVESTESERFSSTIEEHMDTVDRVEQASQAKSWATSVSKNKAREPFSVSDEDMPSLDSSLSTSDEDELAACILREKYKPSAANPDSSDLLEDEDFELLEEIPELIVSTDDSDIENQLITLSSKDVAALQEINITDSSLDEYDGVDGDDEFECDCYLCQLNQTRDVEDSTAKLSQTGPVTAETEPGTTITDPAVDVAHLEDFAPDFISMPSIDDVDTDGFLNSLTVLTSESIRRGILDLMFTNVITHMLSVYPELLSDQTPEPLPPDLFETFPLIKISDKQKDEEVSCPICLCPFELGEDAKLLACDHTFHPLCIQAWLNKARTCPVCRHNLANPITSQGSSQH